MTRCEKYAFASILEIANPEVAIEVGTYNGGSLQLISKKAKKVYSIDISPECKEKLSSIFQNVEFLTGDSKDLLSHLLEKISFQQDLLGFILIDGDHSTKGVRHDINTVLQYTPVCPLYVVFHDSFNPRCRNGLLLADWKDCKYVHFVEIDFIPGVYHYEAFDTAKPRSMHGGLALALMLPEERTGDLVVHQSQKGLFDTVFLDSCHNKNRRLNGKNLLKYLKRRLVALK